MVCSTVTVDVKTSNTQGVCAKDVSEQQMQGAAAVHPTLALKDA
jgi:hypothetical protein